MAGSWRPEPGEVLDGRYSLEHEIGEGPTGAVFAGRDRRTDETVAVKVFHPALFEGSAQGPNLLRLQRARAYVHEGVVRLHDVVVGDRVYAVTDRVEAPSLAQVVQERGGLSRDAILPLIEGAVAALGWIHQIAVHGNLKPDNVFVPDEGGALLGDPWCLEGMAAIPPGELPPPTRQWWAPEQAMGAWKERAETDVHALGRLVVWLLSGRIVTGDRSLAAQGVAVPRKVEAVLLRALAPQPEERFRSVGRWWGVLRDVWTQADWDAAIADEPGVDDGSAGAAGEPHEPLVGSCTEAMPLEEIRAMGLDPGVPDEAEEVEAVVIDVGEDGPGPADSIQLAPGDVVEVSAGRPAEAMEPPELGAPGIGAGPSVRSPEPTRDGSAAPRPEASEAVTYTGSPAPGASPASAGSGRPPERKRRSAMIVIAPLLFVIAAGVVFFALDAVRDRTSIPVDAVEEFRTVRGSAEGTTRAGAVAEPVDRSEPATGVADGASGGSSDAGEEPSRAGRSAGSAVGAVATMVPAEDEAAPSEQAAAEGEAVAGGGEAQGGEAAEAPPEVPEFIGPTPDQLDCPGGMAKVRRKREVKLEGGATTAAWDVWCVDRYEYPGKGSEPRVNVTLAQAESLCEADGKRLCTRPEWRRACGWNYPYDGDYDPDACNTIGADFMPRPLVPSGSKSECRNAWGLYDMVGNAAEWTADGRVNGGSAKKDGASAKCQRSARRKGGSPFVGFRCCADPTRK